MGQFESHHRQPRSHVLSPFFREIISSKREVQKWRESFLECFVKEIVPLAPCIVENFILVLLSGEHKKSNCEGSGR